jgi:hypothetical protein
MKKSMFKFFGVLKFVLPTVYMAGAIFIWINFVTTNPDGLANVWIGLYTFPIFIIGTFLLSLQFPYMPGSYYQAHALYFWPSVIFLAVVIFLVLHCLQKLSQPRLIYH